MPSTHSPSRQDAQRRYHERLRQQGLSRSTVKLPDDQWALLDKVRESRGLRTRHDALTALLELAVAKATPAELYGEQA